MAEQDQDILILYHPNDKTHQEAISKQLKIPLRKMPSTLALQGDKAELKKTIALRQIVLVLVSDDFLSKSMDLAIDQFLFDKRKANKLHLVPVLLEDCPFEFTDFNDLIPENTAPLANSDNPNRLIKQLIISLIREKADILDRLSKAAPVADIGSDSVGINPIAQGFYKLNYLTQKDEIKQYRRKLGFRFQPVNLFLLRGTSKCGHELMIQSFVNTQGFEVDVKAFPLDVYYPNEKNIWPLVRDTLAFDRSERPEPRNIAQKIIDKLKVTNIVLQFNNIHVDRIANLKAINFFWHELSKFIKEATVKPEHYFFIFINDRKNKDPYSVSDFLPTDNQAAFEPFVQLLSPISPVQQNDLMDWIDKLREDSNLEIKKLSRILEQKVVDIIPDNESKVYMLDLIHKVLQVTHLDAQVGTIEKITDLWQEE